jgi:hypothetical protein
MPTRRRLASKWASQIAGLSLNQILRKGVVPLKEKNMPTYKHKPTGSIWDAYMVKGKEVYINRTDAWAVNDHKENITMIPKGIVESGLDWQKMLPEPTAEDLRKPLFSYNDILNLAEQSGQYREFQTQDLKTLLQNRL